MAGKRALITGVSSGIGAETARLFREIGVNVVGLDRNRPSFDVSEFHQVDLSEAVAIDATVAKLTGKFDFLCNVAGVPPTAAKRMVLRVNFFGLRYLTQAIEPYLVDGASIVSVGSLAGADWRANLDAVRGGLATHFDDADEWIDQHGAEGAQSYHLSKELLIAWTAATWDRWRARGIRLNSVSPGPVSTPILTDFIQTLGRRAEDDLKINRAGTVEEIAAVILFLCSPEARWINGADLAVDGGAGASAIRGLCGLPSVC